MIILSAKHGQSPQTPSALTRIDDGPIIDAVNADWAAAGHPVATPVAFAVDDDGMLMWLTNWSPAATDFAKSLLLTHSGVGNHINGNPRPCAASGLGQVLAGKDPAQYFKVAARAVNDESVETTEIAPTILWVLGLNPSVLQAVRIEHTTVMPLDD